MPSFLLVLLFKNSDGERDGELTKWLQRKTKYMHPHSGTHKQEQAVQLWKNRNCVKLIDFNGGRNLWKDLAAKLEAYT